LGTPPSARGEDWVILIEAKGVPEPSTFALLSIGVLAALAHA